MRTKLLLFSAVACALFSCGKSKNENDSKLPAKAETKPQYDNTSFGVYKGVIVGSSGYISFRINNGDNVVKGFLKIDGREDVLTTKETLVAGQPLNNVLFTGSFSSMRISADAYGSNARLTDIKIEGHKYAGGYISHEKSNQQILLYEGNFSGNYSGIINFARVGTGVYDTIFALQKFTGDTMIYTGHGYNDPSFNASLYTYQGEIKFQSGKLAATEEKVTGTWQLQDQKGTFETKRTY